ncbi:unnamed protein product [Meloidogyne enterolobii]|uniref:Uncharacterized protein n=1 Tax=Meloidogyne enterolobii TaxID=390850 RepID=A0ACB0ZWM0_MELEN
MESKGKIFTPIGEPKSSVILEFGFYIKDELRMMRVNSTFQFNTLMRMLRLQEQDLRDQGRDVRELLDRMGLLEYRVGRIEAHLGIGDVANAIIVAGGVPDNAAGGKKNADGRNIFIFYNFILDNNVETILQLCDKYDLQVVSYRR